MVELELHPHSIDFHYPRLKSRKKILILSFLPTVNYDLHLHVADQKVRLYTKILQQLPLENFDYPYPLKTKKACDLLIHLIFLLKPEKFLPVFEENFLQIAETEKNLESHQWMLFPYCYTNYSKEIK